MVRTLAAAELLLLVHTYPLLKVTLSLKSRMRVVSTLNGKQPNGETRRSSFGRRLHKDRPEQVDGPTFGLFDLLNDTMTLTGGT